MKMEPLFSVIIPLFNKVGYIQATLDSVAAQTFKDFEVIVVDDGSTDGSESIVESYDKISVRLVRQANAGAATARNRGVTAAKGKYLAFLDADDVWLNNHLAVFDDLIRSFPQAKMFTSAFKCKHWRNGKWTFEQNGASKCGVVDFFEEFRRYFLCINSVVVHRESFILTHLFAVGYRHGEDWAPFIEMGLNYVTVSSTEVTSVSDRNVAGQTTRSGYAAGELRFLGYLPVLAREFRKHQNNSVFVELARKELRRFFRERVSWGYFHEFAKIYLDENGRDSLPFMLAKFYDVMLRHVLIQFILAKTCRGLRLAKRWMIRQSLSDIKTCPCRFYQKG